MVLLDLDPRWRALMAQGGVVDIGFDHPTDWPHEPRDEQPFVKEGADQLTAELCRASAARYMRAVLSLPIRGTDDHIDIALWVGCPHDLFYGYIEQLDGGTAPQPSLVTLANDLGNVLATDSPLTIRFSNDDARPVVTSETRTDISLEELIDLYALTGTLARETFKAP